MGGVALSSLLYLASISISLIFLSFAHIHRVSVGGVALSSPLYLATISISLIFLALAHIHRVVVEEVVVLGSVVRFSNIFTHRFKSRTSCFPFHSHSMKT